MNRKYLGKAKVFKVEHDLVWEFEIEGKIRRWFGYDDVYWWMNYADNSFYKQKAMNNSVYEIDFHTCEVYLVEKIVNNGAMFAERSIERREYAV